MSDPLFFFPKAPLTLADVLALTQAAPVAAVDLGRAFHHVAALDQAGPRAVAFRNEHDRDADLSRTGAGACLVTPADAGLLPPHTIALLTATPRLAFARLVAALYSEAMRPASMFANRGISPAAFIHPEARLEPDVTIDPGVVIGPKAEIGAGTIIAANSVIGPRVRIGRNCAIAAQVTIAYALIGNEVVIGPGVRIGQDGARALDGGPEHLKIAGLGRVIIQDGVEVGANTTIDRGGLRDTILGERSQIGNLVHIAADTTIERYAVLPATPS